MRATRASEVRKAFAGRRISRRRFLEMGARGLTGAVLLGVAGCGGGGQGGGGTEVVFSFSRIPRGACRGS